MTTPFDTIDTVRIDRRTNSHRRQGGDGRRNGTSNVAVERRIDEPRSGQRRRQIDPTTCERDYSIDEIEFMQALDAYKRSNGRMFPTCSEILEVLRGLGYIRLNDDGTPRPAEISGSPTTSDPEENWED